MAEPLTQAEPASAADGQAQQRIQRLIQLQFGFVWRLLRRVGVAEADADDAAQQVFIAAAGRLGDIRAGSERAFLFSTALHVGARIRRDRTRQHEALGGELDVHSDPAPTPDQLLDRRRARELLDAMLEEMPLELRVVFVLYEIEQLTSVEIADVVGIPTGTVASRLGRAREDFAAHIARIEARRKLGAGQ